MQSPFSTNPQKKTTTSCFFYCDGKGYNQHSLERLCSRNRLYWLWLWSPEMGSWTSGWMHFLLLYFGILSVGADAAPWTFALWQVNSYDHSCSWCFFFHLMNNMQLQLFSTCHIRCNAGKTHWFPAHLWRPAWCTGENNKKAKFSTAMRKKVNPFLQVCPCFKKQLIPSNFGVKR